MFALIRKEINTFFSSAVGYLVIAIFLILNGLFLWVFKGQFNILDSGFADLSPFFPDCTMDIVISHSCCNHEKFC